MHFEQSAIQYTQSCFTWTGFDRRYLFEAYNVLKKIGAFLYKNCLITQGQRSNLCQVNYFVSIENSATAFWSTLLFSFSDLEIALLSWQNQNIVRARSQTAYYNTAPRKVYDSRHQVFATPCRFTPSPWKGLKDLTSSSLPAAGKTEHKDQLTSRHPVWQTSSANQHQRINTSP